jgi:DNA-binding CsgD family transcriptional regulator
LKTANFGPAGYDSSISSFGEKIVYSSSEGIFDLDPVNERLVSDSLLTKTFCDPADRISGKLLIDQRQNKAWGFSQSNILCLSPDIFDATPKATRIPIPSYFRRNQGLTGFENVQWLGAQEYLIGTSVGYVVLDLERVREKEYEVLITSVEKQFQQADREKVSLVESEQSLRYEENNITFNFTVPEYDKYTEVSYQYLLDGLSEEWSAWSSEPSVSFGNLPHGDYEFRVRARIGNKISENEAGFRFTVLKPWFLSGTAIAFYALGIVLLMLLVHRSYRHYYAKQRNKLIEENRKSMELAQLESEQEIMQLKNEQLQKDIDGKNRELAITTMSQINKNELLQGIKNDLLHLQDKSSRDHVVKVINRNLNNDHDWDYFQEAFNNADKDFLKKVHRLHPNLTPNDLKLCAYLRLNLSSKEIAPLLNISVRSVEIKRYRLRKKMQLEHEKSLVEYILEI